MMQSIVVQLIKTQHARLVKDIVVKVYGNRGGDYLGDAMVLPKFHRQHGKTQMVNKKCEYNYRQLVMLDMARGVC